MSEYKILLLSEGKDLSEPDLEKIKNKRFEDSVIKTDDTIRVLTSGDDCDDEDIDVFVGIGVYAEEVRLRAQKARRPALLCDIDCSLSAFDDIDVTIPYTWGLFSRSNKDKEEAFLKHYNLSFVYDADVVDYIASLVLHMLEEFSFHGKYNTNFVYKKQAEFIHEFTQFYLDKMKQLVEADGFVREDIKGDFNHIIYRYRPDDAEKPFKSIDGRDYDFVIEYHRGKPSEGIYYGVKGEVQEGDLEEQCEKFRKEWPNIFMREHKNRKSLTDLQKATTDLLNDTFNWKDYLKCFKPTDNFLKKRYWLFWITLNDDEDVRSVAALAVKLMSRTFEEYLWKGTEFKDRENQEKKGRGRPVKWDKKDNYLHIPYFSDEAYCLLCESYGSKKTLDGWICSMQTEGILHKEPLFDKCYRLNIDAKEFILDYVKSSDNEHNIESPFKKVRHNAAKYYYDLLDRLFMLKDGNKSEGYFRQLGRNE
ncbi:MAG: hypothetical protein ACI4B3_02395 [Prevotella sp.]